MANIDLSGKVAVVEAVRLPIGAIGGGLASLQARELATIVLKKLLERAGIDPAAVQYTSMGWVMQDPRAPNLAKIAAEFAGVPNTVPGTTFHENCNSGGAAIHDMVRRIMVGDIEVGLAGGVESMSNVARYLYAGRTKNQLYGDMTLVDGVQGALCDTNVGEKGELMGLLTERLVEKYKVSRALQDEIAFRSHRNALATWEKGLFADYVVPVEIAQRKGPPAVFAKDEGPKPITMEDLAKQKPYFKKDGTVTAGNSSSINDGAAAVLLMSQRRAQELGKKPIAYIYGYHNTGVPREYMGEGAFKVIPGLLKKTGLRLEDVDFFEMNEAFAAVLGAALNDMPAIDRERANQWGSGVSLGHPVGATGARQVVDMVHQLARRGKKIGLTSRCVGGGMGGAELIVAA